MAGIQIIPYYLGKFIGIFPQLFLQPLAFVLSYYSLAHPRQVSHERSWRSYSYCLEARTGVKAADSPPLTLSTT